MTEFRNKQPVIIFAAVGILAITAAAVLFLLNSLYNKTNMDGLRKTTQTLFTSIGEDRLVRIFAGNGDTDLPVSETGSYRLTLIDPSGYVLWDSHVKDGLVNHINRVEIIAALEGSEKSWRRESTIYYALPVYNGGRVAGVFRLSTAVPGITEKFSSVIFPLLIFLFLLAGVIFYIIFIFSRYISGSINRLENITNTGLSLLFGTEAEEKVALDFRSLENAIKTMIHGLSTRLEQAKAESSRLEAILNGMSEAVFAMDSELKLHLVNPRARKLFNLGDMDIISMSLLEATRSTELEEAAKKALAENGTLETELTFHTGVEQCFQVFASPLSTSSFGVVLVLEDITRLVKLERIRKDFVANVSHELRTPIQLIKGFSETLLDAVSDPEKGSDSKKQIVHFIEIISKNAATMENLTNDLLILADLENSSSNVREMENLNIAPLIFEAVSSVEQKAKRKNIHIIVNCRDSLKAKIHGSFIIQALINLIDNGIKYSPAKSKLWVSADIENGELVLTVRDKGIGISSEHFERIFERFYRVDRARSREAGGTGLGLSIVRHIAMLHNGKAEVESHAGEGSRFRIKIPQN